MPLAVGTRLGPYEIVTPLGAGGMGEVYKARDTRLDRTVAIKVLSATLATDPQFRERFEREARAVSALDHPNICALYDIGREHDHDFLVMQFVDGETLAKRLERGPLKLDEVVRTAMEIASALDKAHRAGIIHRDLKPGNVMLTATGAKLLDFGLAKIVAPTSAPALMSAVPTMELTAEGTILGTFQYMAPEQLEGVDAGPRTDIFAFGALVFEMATGRKAFEGKSRASLIGAILRDEPPPISTVRQQSRPGSSASGATTAWGGAAVDSDALASGLDRVVRRCLAKNPDDRWQTASDLLEALRWVSEGRAAVDRARPVSQRRSIVERAAWATAIVIAVGFAAWGWMRGDVSHRPTRFSFALAAADTLTNNGMAISPDGSAIVVTGTHDGVEMLFRRTLDQLDAVQVRGTEGGQYPFFSPDGKWLGFFSGTAIRKVPTEGGPPSTIAPAGQRFGASWGPDDTIVFASGSSPDLMRVPSAGGRPEVFVPAMAFSGASLRWPAWAPDGSAVLFAIISGSLGSARIGAHAVKSGESHAVTEGTNPVVLPGGQLLFARGGSVWTATLDSKKLTISGAPPAPALEGVQTNAGGLALFAVGANGTSAFRPGGSGNAITVDWVSREGARQPLIDKPQTFRAPRLSPDGRRLAVFIAPSTEGAASAADSESDVWIYEIETKALSRVTFGAGRHADPMWTPDGRRIIYDADSPEKVRNLFATAADGTGQPEQLTRSSSDQVPRAVTPDGKTLVFQQRGTAGSWDILTLPLDGDHKPSPYLQTPFNETDPALSADGRWIAYVSDETGRREVYVRPFPGPGGKWQVSTSGGETPGWSPDGKELYFYFSQNIIAAPIDASGSSFRSGVPRVLFTYTRPAVSPLSVSPDGKRFILLERPEVDDKPHVVVALNALQKSK